jgi:DNA-binding NarL/FixJ family response regulator
LTVREFEIVRNVAAGLRNTEIAERLSITERRD